MLNFFEKRINPYPDKNLGTLPKKLSTFLWKCTEGTRFYIIALIITTACFSVFEAYLFAMLGRVVDWLSIIEPAKLWQDEKSSIFLLIAIICSSVLLIAMQTIIKHQVLAGNFPMRLRWNFHRLMLNQSMSFFQNEFSGRISAKIMQSALAVRDTIFIFCELIVFVIIYFFTMLFIVSSFTLWLLIPFFCWLTLYIIALIYFIPKLSNIARVQADARSLMTGRITDAYTNISTVKLFSHTGREASYARSAMKDFLQSVYAQMRLVSGVEVINHILSMGLILGTSGVTLWLWTIGQVGVGALAASTAMALRLNGMSHWIMWELAMLFENIGVVQDGINTLTIEPSVKDKDDAQKLNITQGEICFKNINFFYDNKQKQAILSDLNLTIHPGEKIGLVGHSGAGKSTLVNLLLRFYNLKDGNILIDGQNIEEVTQDSLRAQIGMVTQDTSLLHRSIRENILYGRPNATDEEMIIAAKKAEADQFINTLVDSNGRSGYDALVGERGLKLSGGQRQRIAIARVMLKNSPILLLDEATSALDSEIELAIQNSLYKLMEGKTVIAIAHRLSTIAAMDRLIVLDKGKIVEEGDHHTLLEKNGVYAQLWKHQSGGFLGK